jgi:hypothetical protein
MSDTLTVLTTADGALATKRISRAQGGEGHVLPYGKAKWFSVDRIEVDGIVSLGRALRSLEPAPYSFAIRGEPLASTDLERTRRLLYEQVDEDGVVWPATFEARARQWLAVDFDDLPAPVWDEDKLARRRAAGGGADPAPIDPARDSEIVCRAALSTLPEEVHDASAWWQMTSSAGLKADSIRLRLWFWLDRPVSDAEVKRWLKNAPVDHSLYSPVQAHYTAAPIFDPPELDPVPVRSGFWWRHVNAVPVPELPEPKIEPTPEPATRWTSPKTADQFLVWRAERYAEAALRGVATATVGGRHPTLLAVAVRLFSLADLGLLDHGEVTRNLDAAGAAPLSPQERRQRCTGHGSRLSANQDAIAWARARADTAPDLPKGFA